MFSTTSPSSTVVASLPTTPTRHSPVSDRSFESEAPSPRPYYMPKITNSPGPIFESSDDVTLDYTSAQMVDTWDKSLTDAMLPSPPSKQFLNAPINSESGVSDTNHLPEATSDQLLDETTRSQSGLLQGYTHR